MNGESVLSSSRGGGLPDGLFDLVWVGVAIGAGEPDLSGRLVRVRDKRFGGSEVSSNLDDLSDIETRADHPGPLPGVVRGTRAVGAGGCAPPRP
jgi:hypothetical protein